MTLCPHTGQVFLEIFTAESSFPAVRKPRVFDINKNRCGRARWLVLCPRDGATVAARTKISICVLAREQSYIVVDINLNVAVDKKKVKIKKRESQSAHFSLLVGVGISRRRNSAS